MASVIVSIPIATAAMSKAAELSADARRRGLATDDVKEIGADAMLAAQARLKIPTVRRGPINRCALSGPSK